MSKYALLGMILQTILFSVISAMDAEGQKNSVEDIILDVDLNGSKIKDAFGKIEEITDFKFSYKLKAIDDKRIENMATGQHSLGEILREIGRKGKLKFRRVNEVIHVSRSLVNDAGYLTERASLADIEISGKVTDENGQGLPGASIVQKGTTNGVTSDLDGNYKLTVPEGSILTISFVGYMTEERVVGTANVIDIQMVLDTEQLEEIVVVGYGTQKKANVTGSVATVQSKEITAVPVADVTGVLAGRLPGLIVNQTTGRPGDDGADIFIRGFGANGTGGQQGESPLVIVDGFQRDFNQLDPNEIESITILKDASAAVYGVRAAAGVILVTTKRGIAGKPVITYNGNYSLTESTKFPEYASYLDYKKAWEQHSDGEQPSRVTPANGWITTERFNALESGADPGTDWWDVATNNFAVMKTHNLNVRGGSEQVKYFVSGGFLDQGTMWETGDGRYKRYNATVNLDAKITNSLDASFNIGWRKELREDPQGFNDLLSIGFAHPAFPATVPEGRLPVVNTENPWSPITSTSRDNAGYRDTKFDALNGSLGLKYKIPGIEGLNLKADVAFYQTNQVYKQVQKSYTLYAWNDNGWTPGQNHGGGNHTLTDRTASFSRATTQFSINYAKQLGDHSISALLLLESISQESENFSASAASILSPSVPYLATADPSTVTVGSGGSEYGRSGLVGRLNYNFKQRYLMEFSFRRDQSAYFPKNSRTGFFPGLSAGWIVSNEGFFDNVNFIDRLKIRGSVARLGNDQANQYDFVEGFGIQNIDNGNNGYVWEGSYQNSIVSLGTPNLFISWQKADLYNLGFETSFLDNKLSFEFEAFYRRRFDLLKVDNQNVNLPGTVGADVPLKNIESRTNRGFETIVSYRSQINELKFNVSGNVSWAREKYDFFLEPEDRGDPDLNRIEKRSGQWVNRQFGYQFDGFFNDQAEIDALDGVLDYFNGQNANLKPGDIKLKDSNGDGIIDNRDRVLIGRSGTPEIIFGLNTTANWKGFDFTMFWQGAANFNQNITSQERGLEVAVNGSRTPFKYVTDRLWTVENQGVGAEFPVDVVGPTNTQTMDKYYLDSKYVRLKNLVLGYTIPTDIAQKVGASSLRCYFSGTNPLTIDGIGFYSLDPESGDRSTYPAQRVFTLGVNFSF